MTYAEGCAKKEVVVIYRGECVYNGVTPCIIIPNIFYKQKEGS